MNIQQTIKDVNEDYEYEIKKVIKNNKVRDFETLSSLEYAIYEFAKHHLNSSIRKVLESVIEECEKIEEYDGKEYISMIKAGQLAGMINKNYNPEYFFEGKKWGAMEISQLIKDSIKEI